MLETMSDKSSWKERQGGRGWGSAWCRLSRQLSTAVEVKGDNLLGAW